MFRVWLAVSNKLKNFTTLAMTNADDGMDWALAPIWNVARACCSQSLIACLIIKSGDDSTINFDADILGIAKYWQKSRVALNLFELDRRGTSE